MKTVDASRFSDPTASSTNTGIPNGCPKCESRLIVTTSRHPSESSYWRCRDCGEIWNAARRHDNPHRRRRW